MVTAPALLLDDLPAPRRAVIAELLETIHHAEGALAALYAARAARPGPPALRAALDELADVHARRVTVTAVLARAASGPGLEPSRGPAPGAVVGLASDREVSLAPLFETSRALEVAYREVAILIGDVSRCPALPALAAEAARLRQRLRTLYVRYS